MRKSLTASAQAPPDHPAKILVVDDDEANLIAVRAVLAELGHPVVTAGSGEEALRHLLREDFAVILLDVRMPGMDGYEVAELIRGRERSRHVPIIFLSGIDKDQAHLFRGYAAGAVDFVFKPVEPVILRSKVAVFAELYEKTREVRRQAEQEKRLLAENLDVRARQTEVSAALERSLMQQSLVIDTLPLALFVASPGEGYLQRRFVGGNVSRLCGIAEAELADDGFSWLDRVHEHDRERLLSLAEAAGGSGLLEAEYRFLRDDGSTVWLFERATLRPGGNGREPEIMGVLTDVSERKRLEEQLTHAHKLEAVGQMSGSIAHDFNNMLSVIIGSLDRVIAGEGLDARAKRRLSLAMQAAESCADLTKRLLGFARRQSLEPRELHVGAEIERLKGLFERVLGEAVTSHVECEGALPPAYIDPSQFEAALVNLAVNARDAMPDGGTLTVSARAVEVGGREAAEAGIGPGGYVRLSVADDGTGMSAETRVRALEPFFTTKEAGKGTGLGLSTIYGFMRQSGGGMRIESTRGAGTTVHLYLPHSPRSVTAPAPPQRASAPTDFGGLRVLVVEDNDDVREVASSMLESLGCEVIALARAEAALRFVEETGGVSVLFTDCVMPGEIDGPKLAALLTERHGDLPVLFTSGYRGSSDPFPTTGSAFLPKPYTQEQLATALEGLLGDRMRGNAVPARGAAGE